MQPTILTYTTNALTIELTMYKNRDGYHDVCDGLGILENVPGIRTDLDWEGVSSFDFEISLACGITYDYTDPDEYTNGDHTEGGYAVLEVPKGARESDRNLDLCLGLIPLPMALNNWDFRDINTDTVLDEAQIETLFDHQYSLYHEGVLVKTLAEFIGLMSYENFSLSFCTSDQNHCSLSIHSPHHTKKVSGISGKDSQTMYNKVTPNEENQTMETLLSQITEYTVNPKYYDQWFQLGGDVNAKDHGGTYIKGDSLSLYTAEYRSGDGQDLGINEETNKPIKYITIESCFDMADVKEHYPDYARFIGLDDSNYDIDSIDEYIRHCIDGLVSSGCESEYPELFSSFSKAMKWLGWNSLPKKWIPSDYFILK